MGQFGRLQIMREKKRIVVEEMNYLRRACEISRKYHIRNKEIRMTNTVDRIETSQVRYGHVRPMNEDRRQRKHKIQPRQGCRRMRSVKLNI